MGAGGGKLQEQLVGAIKANDIATLNQLIEKNKVQKPQLNSLLHVAVQHPGSNKIIDRLLELGADLCSLVDDPFKGAMGGYVSGKGVNVLHRAALSGQGDIFNLLLDKGAAAQSLYDQKCTLQREEGGTDGGITPFYCLLVGNFSDEGQRTGCANKLLSTNKIDIENKFGSDNSTALLVAQLHGRNMIVQTLIAGRANLKATNTKGECVFHMWARYHARFVANLAMKTMSDLRNVYNVGEKEAVIVGMFLRMGLDVHCTDNEGNTPMHIAAYEYSYIWHGLAMKMAYTDHMEAFHRSVTCKTLALAKYNIDTKNKKGETADFVIERGVGFRQAEFDRQKKVADLSKKK